MKRSCFLNKKMHNGLIFMLIMFLMAVITACAPISEQYDLTLGSTEGGSVITPGEGTFEEDVGAVVDLFARPSEGYRFVNWTGDVAAVASVYNTSTTVTMNDHYSITAVFEKSEGILETPAPPNWDPQKQALLPDREFDDNWTMVNNWFPALNRGITAIWLSWDEGPSIISSPEETNASTMLGLSAGHPPGEGTRILRCIFAKNLPDGVSLDLIVQLYAGEELVDEWIEKDVPATWTIREYVLPSELNVWDDLRVSLTRQGETTAPEADLRHINVSLVEVEIPYPDRFEFPYLNPATTTHAPQSDTVQRPAGVQEGDLIFACSFNGEAAEGFQLILEQSSIKAASRPYVMRTWWKRAGADEPAAYTFPNAEGIWAARISGAASEPITAAGHVEPPPDGFVSPLGIQTPSVDAPVDHCLVIRISANHGYITWTEPHQWIAWNEWPCSSASWRIQKEAGPTGEEYHGTGSFIHWVAQTIVIPPE